VNELIVLLTVWKRYSVFSIIRVHWLSGFRIIHARS